MTRATRWRLGLIPAHAGKTIRLRAELSTSWAHPRSRGENVGVKSISLSLRGSSPLTRGKPVSGGVPEKAVRLIPAHAGKTAEQTTHAPPLGAHPRSRGENPLSPRGCELLVGSSPLTRGKPPPPPARKNTPRLIPAHAGKTLPDLRFYRADRSDLGKP